MALVCCGSSSILSLSCSALTRLLFGQSLQFRTLRVAVDSLEDRVSFALQFYVFQVKWKLGILKKKGLLYEELRVYSIIVFARGHIYRKRKKNDFFNPSSYPLSLSTSEHKHCIILSGLEATLRVRIWCACLSSGRIWCLNILYS